MVLQASQPRSSTSVRYFNYHRDFIIRSYFNLGRNLEVEHEWND